MEGAQNYSPNPLPVEEGKSIGGKVWLIIGIIVVVLISAAVIIFYPKSSQNAEPTTFEGYERDFENMKVFGLNPNQKYYEGYGLNVAWMREVTSSGAWELRVNDKCSYGSEAPKEEKTILHTGGAIAYGIPVKKYGESIVFFVSDGMESYFTWCSQDNSKGFDALPISDYFKEYFKLYSISETSPGYSLEKCKEESENDDVCYLALALAEDNIELCESIESSNNMMRCVVYVSISNSQNYCDRLGEEKENCDESYEGFQEKIDSQ